MKGDSLWLMCLKNQLRGVKMNNREWRNRVIHFIMILSLCLAIIAVPIATIRGDSSAEYTASEIQNWLINQIESTTVPYTIPTVDMSTEHEMQIDASMTILGTSIALNHVVFTFDGTTTVKVNGELSLLGKSPRFGQDGNDIECTVECQAGGTPHLSGISNINIADYWPSLLGSDLDTIMDTINSTIDASGWTLSSLEGALTGIDVNSSGELVLSWSGGSASLDHDTVVDKLQSVMDTLVDETNNYLSTGNSSKWDLTVSIVTDTSLTFNAQATIFGITTSVTNLDITFGDCSDMVASCTDATVSLGSKTATFSGCADISCTDCIPSLTITGLSAGDEYPGLRDLIVDYETALCDALSTLVSNVIGDTGLTCCLETFNNIGIVGRNLKVWLDGILITGVTHEVNCDLLGGALVELLDGEDVIASTTSDSIDGSYTLTAPSEADYQLRASKAEFRTEIQPATVGTEPVDLDFCGEHGLIPNAPDVFYVMSCVGCWQFPENQPFPCCGLDVFRIMGVVGAWQFPA